MEIVFKSFMPSDPRTAPPGELHLRERVPAANHQFEGLIEIALDQEKGLNGFVRGEGSIQRIVIRLDPSLDDMLAALVVQELLENRSAPQAKALADYAVALRKGVRPSSKVPFHDSPHAIFRAIRNLANRNPDDRLDDPETAGRFLAGWERMARKFREAFAANRDPLKDRKSTRLNSSHLGIS